MCWFESHILLFIFPIRCLLIYCRFDFYFIFKHQDNESDMINVQICKKKSEPVNILILFHDLNEIKRITHAIAYNLIHGQLDHFTYWAKKPPHFSSHPRLFERWHCKKNPHKSRLRMYIYIAWFRPHLLKCNCWNCSCDKVYHKHVVRFILYILDQIVFWPYISNPLN